MEFFEAIEARRSVRKFKPEAVDEDKIRKAIQAALLAPNSSNMQPWEFYWVRSPEKKAALAAACFSQPAATTAAELIVAVARVDTWKRNLALMLATFEKSSGKVPASALSYYRKLVPMMYWKDPFGIAGLLSWLVFTIVGFFKPVPRSPYSRSALFAMVSKTTALACENLMLALTAQGLGSCPMEGFDERRVKKILGLGRGSQVVMIVSTGVADSAGVFGPRIRFDSALFVHEV
jgi:nitroreductase